MGSDCLDDVRWIVLSNSRLEQVALGEFARKMGAGEVFRGSHDSRSYRQASASGASGAVVLSGLGDGDLRDGALDDLVSAFPEAMIAVFLRDGCPLPEAGSLAVNVCTVLRSDLSEEQMCRALELALGGYHVLPPPAMAACRTLAAEPAPLDDAFDVLTSRELEVCSEISSGRSNKEIARRLGITVNTVNVHVASIRRKLGVRNRTQIALRVARTLLPMPPGGRPAGVPAGVRLS